MLNQRDLWLITPPWHWPRGITTFRFLKESTLLPDSLQKRCSRGNKGANTQHNSLKSFPYFLPFRSLMSCAVLPTLFGGIGSHLKQWLFAQLFPSWGFPGFPSAVRQMPGDLCTASGIISLLPLSYATDVTDVTLGASARNPNRSCWHRHISVNLILVQPKAPLTQKKKIKIK